MQLLRPYQASSRILLPSAATAILQRNDMARQQVLELLEGLKVSNMIALFSDFFPQALLYNPAHFNGTFHHSF
jgi:hypothetical protein